MNLRVPGQSWEHARTHSNVSWCEQCFTAWFCNQTMTSVFYSSVALELSCTHSASPTLWRWSCSIFSYQGHMLSQAVHTALSQLTTNNNVVFNSTLMKYWLTFCKIFDWPLRCLTDIHSWASHSGFKLLMTLMFTFSCLIFFRVAPEFL